MGESGDLPVDELYLHVLKGTCSKDSIEENLNLVKKHQNGVYRTSLTKYDATYQHSIQKRYYSCE
jgi:hypothetical protein